MVLAEKLWGQSFYVFGTSTSILCRRQSLPRISILAPNSLTQCTHRWIPAHFFPFQGTEAKVDAVVQEVLRAQAQHALEGRIDAPCPWCLNLQGTEDTEVTSLRSAG
jgi:hypothetical protein